MNLLSLKLSSQKKQLIENEMEIIKYIQQIIGIIIDEIALYQSLYYGVSGPYFSNHIQLMFDNMYRLKTMFLTDENDNILALPITSKSVVIGYGMRKIGSNTLFYSPIIKLCHIFAENKTHILPLNRLINGSVNLNEADTVSYMEAFCQLKKCINDMYSILSSIVI